MRSPWTFSTRATAMRDDLRQVLARAAEELADLARTAEQLQGQLTLEPSAARPCSAPAISVREPVVALQSIDYLTQALQCLSAFLAIAASAAPEQQGDLSAALGTIWLGRLRARLEGAPLPAQLAAEVELFDTDPAPARG